jgi:hypothetical protein
VKTWFATQTSLRVAQFSLRRILLYKTDYFTMRSSCQKRKLCEWAVDALRAGEKIEVERAQQEEADREKEYVLVDPTRRSGHAEVAASELARFCRHVSPSVYGNG